MRRMPPTLPEFVAAYGLLYAAFGVQSPFLPALLREQGLHPEEIGIVLGASTAIRVLAGPAISHAAGTDTRTRPGGVLARRLNLHFAGYVPETIRQLLAVLA